MSEKYDEEAEDAEHIFKMLGFETECNPDDGLTLLGYDSKTGQEDLFLKAIEFDAEGTITWRGEEGESWTTTFLGDTIISGDISHLLLTN
jgi:hypothetical protein